MVSNMSVFDAVSTDVAFAGNPFWVVLVGNPTMGTSEVVDKMDNKAISRIIKLTTIVVKGVEKVFIVAEMADQVAKTLAEMKILIETRMIPMINANLLTNNPYLHPYKL